jgi:hypothetical protein
MRVAALRGEDVDQYIRDLAEQGVEWRTLAVAAKSFVEESRAFFAYEKDNEEVH